MIDRMPPLTAENFKSVISANDGLVATSWPTP